MSQSSTNPLEQREKEESMNYYRLVSLWIVFAAFCIFGWINHREHTIALEAQNGWRAAVAELHRCSQQAHAAAFDANLRFEQLQADVACALGEKPQPGFWTKVRTVDGGMWIWFTGDEFVEVGRWATLAATNPATALHATDEPAKDKFQARYGVRP